MAPELGSLSKENLKNPMDLPKKMNGCLDA
jgi:hypothetical protein